MAAFTSKLFSEWDDFPNGLKVMVVDRDTTVLAHIQARLEELHYVVVTYSCENDALRALSDPACRFHLAIVEAQCEDLEHGSKLIEAAVKLPTVLMSDTENMVLMLRGLACGAVEVMTKPLSDYKLRNIWQHVLRKDSAIGKNSALKADQTSMVVAPAEVMALKEMKMEQRNGEVDTVIDECPTPVNTADADQEGDHTIPAENDSYSVSDDVAVLDASTELVDGMNMAGIIMGIRSEMDEECSDLCDQLLALNESRSKGDMSLGELDEVLADPYLLDLSLDVDFPADGDLLSDLSMESSSILDITFDGEVECRDEEVLLLAEVARVEKQISGVDTNNVDSGMSSSSSSSSLVNPAPFAMTEGDCNKPPPEHMSTTGEKQNSYDGKKKAKVDWTPELHRRFVQAVEQLGVDNAIPSRILEVMGVQCLTRHNIASHLQKYRSHRRRVQARKTSDARCSSTKKLTPATVPTHANPAASIHQRVFHVWGHPAIHHMHPYVWPTSPGYWQNPTDGTFWQQPHHGLPHPNQGCIDVWGHPAVMPTPAPPGLYPRQTMRMPLAPLRKAANTTVTVPTTSLVETQGCEEAYSGLSLFEEAVTAAIKEAMSNPCAPLPLGLKPPSVDSVVLELQKQGGSIPSLLIHH